MAGQVSLGMIGIFFFYFSAMETCFIKVVLENYLTYFKKYVFFKIKKDDSFVCA